MADNTLEINKTALWWEHYKALHEYRVTVSQGGSSSGKTYCILDCLLYMMCTEKNLVITVVSVSYPSIRRGSFRDTMSIWQDSPMYKTYISKPTINGCACEATGSVLEYASYHDTISARSGKRDILYINEANGIPFEIAHELIIRTRKCMVFDYNPNTKFWVHERYENNSQAKWIFSTHKANPYLPQAIHEELEALRFTDFEKFLVYGLGVSGQVEGCVITDWALCDDLPEKSESKWVCYGLDWGFTCFTGDTMITTDHGDVPISEIKVGDLVATSYGYRKAEYVHDNGIKDVTEKEITVGSGDYISKVNIKATLDHKFYTNESWKSLKELTKKDTLCMISSSTAERSQRDLMRTMLQNITSVLTRRTASILQKGFTKKCISTIKVRSQKDMLSIISTRTLTTTISRILKQYPEVNMVRSTDQNLLNVLESSIKSTQKKCLATQKKTGKSAGRRSTKYWHQSNSNARLVDAYSLLLTLIRNTVRPNAIISTRGHYPNFRKSTRVNTAARRLCTIILHLLEPAQKNVDTHSVSVIDIETKSSRKERVYDLTVNGCHEYFANGILVHNCDPTALVEVRFAHGMLWVRELIYKKGMTNFDIAETIKQLGLQNEDIICDSAEQKSISELHRLGIVNARACIKGPGSVQAGLDLLKTYKIMVTRDSDNLKSELLNYKYKTDVLGHFTNVPEDRWNHILDAARYTVSYKFERPKSRTYLGRM